MKRILVLLALYYGSVNAQPVNFSFTNELQPAVFSLSMVMMHDVVNPPAASRYYAYCILGAHAIASANNNLIKPASTFIKNFPPINISVANNTYSHQLAIIYCILETGKQMLPSGYQLKEEEDKLISKLQRAKMPQKMIDQSIAVAVNVTNQIIDYSKKDNYNKLSGLLRYTPSTKPGTWFPTPPQYMEAVEPHWNIIRPMVVDSATEFKPMPLTPYSNDTASPFFRLAKEVYTISKEQVPEHILMANFWDCNPFFLATSGHMALGFKKISPGGHWMNIGCIAAKKAKLNLDQAIEMLSVEAAALMDAFICCWEEKYKSNRIRPETFINKHIDVRWQPILQTPPFPEYASGHSVISNAAAKVLTYLLGDGFAYTDDTEMLFDIPQRSFRSFNHAADEATISRLYGGIHYRDGVEFGQIQGKAIGDFIVGKIKTAGIMPFKQ